MTSIGTMVRQLAGLLGTNAITDWENNFIASIGVQSDGGTDTRKLSGKQVDTVTNIWRKHFA